jgi:hypothetical protein
VQGLSNGVHKLYAHAYEAPANTINGGRWGSYNLAGAEVDFVVDKQGPVTTGPATLTSPKIDPNPNNGRSAQAGNLNFLDSLQVTAKFDDTATGGSVISLGEVFVTDTGKNPSANPDLFAAGTGSEMYPDGARWDSATKIAWAYIPLAILTSYPEGHVAVWTHAQDIAGNWGPFTYTDLVLDRTAPAWDLALMPPSYVGSSVGTCNDTTPCSIHYAANDPVSGGVNSNIISGEWFIGQGITRLPGDDVAVSNDPGQGNGMPFSVLVPGTSVDGSFTITKALLDQYRAMINASTSSFAPGASLTIVYRVRDAAGNWTPDTYVMGTA